MSAHSRDIPDGGSVSRPLGRSAGAMPTAEQTECDDVEGLHGVAIDDRGYRQRAYGWIDGVQPRAAASFWLLHEHARRQHGLFPCRLCHLDYWQRTTLRCRVCGL